MRAAIPLRSAASETHTRGMTLPNFYLLGAPKAGTTTLHAWLSQHPDVFLPAEKEPHFLQYRREGGIDREIARVKTREKYEALFAAAAGKRVVGEASTLSLFFPEAAERIRELTPGAKMAAVLRHPVDRAWSHYHFRVALGREKARTFETALEVEPLRIAELEPVGGWYMEVGRYAPQVARYRSMFAQEQTRFWLFDDLVADPQRLMRELFEFLGIDASVAIDISAKKNVTLVPASRTFDGAMRHRGPLRRVAAALLPGGVKKKLYELRRSTRKPAPKMPAELRAQLAAKCREDILRLQDVLGRDLSTWLEPAG